MTRPHAPVTDRQHLVAGALRACLRQHSAVFSEATEGGPGDSVLVFEIGTNDPRLAVSLRIIDDAFHVRANEALLVVDRGADPHQSDHAWAAECVWMLESLLRGDLHLRIRKPLFGRRVGAIWVSGAPGPGGWSGEAGAAAGRGTELVFRDWYRTSSSPPPIA